MRIVCVVMTLGYLLIQISTVSAGQQVMLDPGHSRRSPGATSCSGEKEYRYNQALADTVQKKLQQAGITTSLTTDRKPEANLKERATSSQGYELLISLHHDSVQPRFVTTTKTGGVCSDKAAGFSIFVSTKNPAYLQSLDYATRLSKALVTRGMTPSLHHAEPISGENRVLLSKELGIYQYDDLQVLKEAPVPALLLEAAVIVSRSDEARAATPAFRASIADAIMEIVKQGAKQCSGTCKLPAFRLL